MGGLPAGPVERDEHAYDEWEQRVDALMMLLSDKERRLLRVDELRRNIESLGAEAYDRMGYYERWMHAIAQTLIQRGVISIDELGTHDGGRGRGRWALRPRARTSGPATASACAPRTRRGTSGRRTIAAGTSA